MTFNFMTLSRLFGLAGWLLVSPAYATSMSQNSIYQIESSWLDQDGKTLLLSSFAGKKQLVSFIYTHCLHTCPTIVSTMQTIEKSLSEAEKHQVGFILISLTPDSDTPEVLKKFAQQRQLNTAKWSLLTGNANDVRTLAMALNIKYQNLAENEVNHSNLITGLDKQGRIKFQEIGIPNNTKKVQDALSSF